MENRFCVFCGAAPNKKNKEHVLPQWLLSLTGDPKRVVNFGQDFRTGKIIRFDWSSFVVPSCTECNNSHSALEAKAKGLIDLLINRESLTSIQYIDLLDWLDKVRIATWLAYHQIQGNPTNIDPSFFVDTRSGVKDRMIAVYPANGQTQGLNALGVESLLFHRQPSCFALRINDILLLNMSSDYLFAARCGFPYPKTQKLNVGGKDHGKLVLSNFQISRRVKHPLLRCSLKTPAVHLYQPMLAKDNTDSFQSGFIGDNNIYDSYILQHTLPPHPSGKGILFSQKPGGVTPIYDTSLPIEFNQAGSANQATMQDLVQQVYKMQIWIFEKTNYTSSDPAISAAHSKVHKQLLKSEAAAARRMFK